MDAELFVMLLVLFVGMSWVIWDAWNGGISDGAAETKKERKLIIFLFVLIGLLIIGLNID